MALEVLYGTYNPGPVSQHDFPAKNTNLTKLKMEETSFSWKNGSKYNLDPEESPAEPLGSSSS